VLMVIFFIIIILFVDKFGKIVLYFLNYILTIISRSEKMRVPFVPKTKLQSLTFDKFIAPLSVLSPLAPVLLSRGDRPLKMSFEDQLKSLIPKNCKRPVAEYARQRTCSH
jgi:hypothetical protein